MAGNGGSHPGGAVSCLWPTRAVPAGSVEGDLTQPSLASIAGGWLLLETGHQQKEKKRNSEFHSNKQNDIVLLFGIPVNVDSSRPGHHIKFFFPLSMDELIWYKYKRLMIDLTEKNKFRTELT